MGNLRLTLTASLAFAAAFGGIFWASKGFPLWSPRAAVVKTAEPMQIPDAVLQTTVHRDRDSAKVVHGNVDPDMVRSMTLQAATAYARSPCNVTIKRNLVDAVTSYAAFSAERASCRDGICSGAGEMSDDDVFRTPADIRVHQALRAAIDKGGIAREDFPKSVQKWIGYWTNAGAADPHACFGLRKESRRQE